MRPEIFAWPAASAPRALVLDTNIGQNADRVAGTPTFFINGRNAAVVQWTALKTKLDAALKGS